MIDKILQKYKCHGYYPNIVEECKNYAVLESELYAKWSHRIGENWYGFELGAIPDTWYHVIDEFLDYLDSITKIEIHQIKLKFGSIRFYVEINEPDEEKREFIDLQVDRLEQALSCRELIY